MDKIEDPVEVWDTGAISPFNPPSEDIVIWFHDFFAATGARRRVATRWRFDGQIYESPNRAVPVPDFSGLVYATSDSKRWVLLSPDGSTKGVIEVPCISSRSKPENGTLGEPQYLKGEAPYVMSGEGSDGDRDDCRFFFDLHTGQLVRVQLVGRHW